MSRKSCADERPVEIIDVRRLHKHDCSSELIEFLEEVDQCELLDMLRHWGARRIDDLLYLSEDDMEELGVANNIDFRQALKRIEKEQEAALLSMTSFFQIFG